MLRRRKNEGFEWREYVRTTILVRRKERRQRVEDVKVAAVEGLKDAGRKGMEAGAKGAKSASETAVGLVSRMGSALAASARGAGPAARSLMYRMRRAVEDGYVWLRDRLVPILGEPLSSLRTPRSLLVLKGTALALILLAAFRALQFGVDTDTTVALSIATAAAALYALLRMSDPDPASDVPSISAKLGALLSGLPGLNGYGDRARGAALLGLAGLGLAGAFAWKEGPSFSDMAGALTTGSTSAPEAPASLEGRATAVSGASLKLQGATLVLDGIEAPEMDQICRKPGGSWRCGESAKQDLADTIRGKRIVCDRLGDTQDGRVRARCTTAGGEDLARVLVAKGSVFASDGLFGAYASEQDTAKEKRLGLWAGENERPDDYRAKRWDEAKKQAPEGCPIKGRVRSGSRVYVLPWSPSYDSVRINTGKGERWFCTEDEAIAAGWRKAASL